MHSRHGTLLDTRAGIIDHFAEWLLRHCPFTTLTVLTLLVVGSRMSVPRPLALAVVVPLADVTLNVVRRRRRPSAARRSPA